MPTITIQDVPVPTWFYGTAWKEDRTEGCVTAALEAGFRAIDTASQRKHYFEAGVGQALARAFEGGAEEVDTVLRIGLPPDPRPS